MLSPTYNSRKEVQAMLFYIILTVIAAWLLVKSSLKLRLRHQRLKESQQQIKPVKEWLNKVEATRDDKELQQLGSSLYYLDYYLLLTEDKDRMNRARRKCDDAVRRLTTIDVVFRLTKTLREADSPANLIIAYLKILGSEYMVAVCEQLGMSPHRIKVEIRNQLLQLFVAAREDSVHFDALRSEWDRVSKAAYDAPRGQWLIRLPDDWDDLVTQYIENPNLHDYAHVNIDRQRGEVRLMAAEALRTRSLKDAKIVLAFCNHWQGNWREEAGDALLAELAKLGDVLHAERGLFATVNTE